MSETQPQTDSFEKDLCGIAGLHRFRHGAMAASFDVFIIHPDAEYAGQAARAAFEELDRIESNLSRFLENSDVSRINSLGWGHPLQIGLEIFECLQTSIEMSKQTNGAFDITFASCHRGSDLLKLNESEHTIESQADGIKIDLGAIGKGYAADKMRQVFRDWGIDTVLISAGNSTVLPIGIPSGMPGWPVTLSDPGDYSRLLGKINLSGSAISSSGIRKGPHIINPRSGKPAKRLGAWALAQTAALADALSTAFMVMSVDEVRSFCKTHPDTSALLVLPAKNKNQVLRFGRWDKKD
jgi:thiamine biosynthesis lipoprotein